MPKGDPATATGTGSAGSLHYVAVEPCWAFPSPQSGSPESRRRRCARLARDVLEAQGLLRSLPSALEPLRAACRPRIDERQLARVTRTACDNPGSWIRVARDGHDVVGESDFARHHVKLTGHPWRFAQVLDHARWIECREDGGFTCMGEDVEDVSTVMRICAVSIDETTMHFMGDPICVQSITLDVAQAHCRKHGLDDVNARTARHHIESLRDREAGCSSRGVAADLDAYDHASARSWTREWLAGVVEVAAIALRCHDETVCNHATVAMARALDVPISTFTRLAADDATRRERLDEYLSRIDELDASKASLEEADEIAHARFDAHEGATLEAMEAFLTRSARTLASNVDADHSGSSLHAHGDARYLVTRGEGETVMACWMTGMGKNEKRTFH